MVVLSGALAVKLSRISWFEQVCEDMTSPKDGPFEGKGEEVGRFGRCDHPSLINKGKAYFSSRKAMFL